MSADTNSAFDKAVKLKNLGKKLIPKRNKTTWHKKFQY